MAGPCGEAVTDLRGGKISLFLPFFFFWFEEKFPTRQVPREMIMNHSLIGPDVGKFCVVCLSCKETLHDLLIY